MKKNLFSLICALFIVLLALPATAGSTYLYRQRVNWVKIAKASPKEVPLGSLKHPYTGISEEQMEAMLLSVKLSKKYLLKHDVETVDVFNSWEARKLAPYLVDGLRQVDADHVINFAIIHKRPLFILQNDHLSIANLWAGEDGIHFRFSKLFAKIEGDYLASANTDKSVRKAKSMRVSLDAGPGQKLAYESPMEIILDPGFDFVSQVAVNNAEDKVEEDKLLQGKPSKANPVVPQPAKKPVAVAAPASEAEPQDMEARLRKLDELKEKKLITNSEYQKLRQKILQEI